MTINVCHTRKLTGKFNSPFTLVGEKLNSPVVVVTWFSRGRRDSPLFSFCTRLSELKVLARTRRRRKSTVTFLMHTTCTRSSHFHVHKRRAFFKKIISHTNTPDPNRLASTDMSLPPSWQTRGDDSQPSVRSADERPYFASLTPSTTTTTTTKNKMSTPVAYRIRWQSFETQWCKAIKYERHLLDRLKTWW